MASPASATGTGPSRETAVQGRRPTARYFQHVPEMAANGGLHSPQGRSAKEGTTLCILGYVHMKARKESPAISNETEASGLRTYGCQGQRRVS